MKFSRYIVGRLTDDYLCFIGRLSVNLLDVLWGVSLSVISIYFQESHDELYRYYVRRLAVSILDKMSDFPQSVSIFCQALLLSLCHREFSLCASCTGSV